MASYLVWDKDNSDEESAWDIEADDVEDAAICYAKQDCDGQSDGIYGREPLNVLEKQGCRVCVREVATGSYHEVMVGIIEYNPVWDAKVVSNA